MLGLESMPYCWAAKSIRKDVGASQRAVECGIPILKDEGKFCFGGEREKIEVWENEEELIVLLVGYGNVFIGLRW